MSTFSEIKTAIRDASVMQRVLETIPGAVIHANARIPIKTGGFATVEFQVTLPESGAVGDFFGGLVKRGLRYFNVRRATDGTLFFEVNEEQIDHKGLESLISSALRPAEALADAAAQKRTDNQRAEIDRLFEAYSRRLEADQSRAMWAASQDDLHLLEEREDLADRARLEAVQLLGQIDRKLHSRAAQALSNDAGTPSSDAGIVSDLTACLAQKYARAKILSQIEQIEQQYGVRLGGEVTLQDGTIEITLKG